MSYKTSENYENCTFLWISLMWLNGIAGFSYLLPHAVWCGILCRGACGKPWVTTRHCSRISLIGARFLPVGWFSKALRVCRAEFPVLFPRGQRVSPEGWEPRSLRGRSLGWEAVAELGREQRAPASLWLRITLVPASSPLHPGVRRKMFKPLPALIIRDSVKRS